MFLLALPVRFPFPQPSPLPPLGTYAPVGAAERLHCQSQKEMKYAHKFHIVFMIFSFVFRLSFCSFFFSSSSSFLAFFFFLLYTFIGFPMGFGVFLEFTNTHTHTSLGIGYRVEEVSKMELGKGGCTSSSFSSQPQLVACSPICGKCISLVPERRSRR